MGNLRDFLLVFLVWDWSSSSSSSSSEDEWDIQHKTGKFKLPTVFLFLNFLKINKIASVCFSSVSVNMFLQVLATREVVSGLGLVEMIYQRGQ